MNDQLKTAMQEVEAALMPGAPLTDSAQCAAWTLAKAYLAEHPADDEEPVTGDWLLSIGFEPDATHLVLRRFGPDENGKIQVYLLDRRWLLHGTRIKMLCTRGDVRRLCAALRVPLKEGAK